MQKLFDFGEKIIMKKIFVLSAMFCLLAISALAQNKTDFSGKWELDASKSKLDERARIEAMTMTVTQSEKEIKIETATKRAPRPEGEMPSGGTRGGGRGGFGGGDGTFVYNLEKETTVNQESSMGSIPVTLKAKAESDGKLKLSSSRTFNSPMGEVTMKTTETWELVDGGKALKVKREIESPGGARTSEMYFVKK